MKSQSQAQSSVALQASKKTLLQKTLLQRWKPQYKIDVHMHLPGASIPWIDSSDDVVMAAESLGIREMWCSVPITGGRIAPLAEVRACNDIVLEAIRDYPKLVRGYCYIDPSNPQAALGEMERCRAAGMIGVKLYNQLKITDPRVEPIARRALQLGMVILTHAGHLREPKELAAQPNISDAADICAFAARFPNLPIIQGHIGGGGDWEWTLRTLRNCENVYLDTSGSGIDADMVLRCVEELGVNRVLFATDTWMEEGVGKVVGAELTAKERDQVFYLNAQALLNKLSAR